MGLIEQAQQSAENNARNEHLMDRLESMAAKDPLAEYYNIPDVQETLRELLIAYQDTARKAAALDWLSDTAEIYINGKAIWHLGPHEHTTLLGVCETLSREAAMREEQD